MDVQSTPGVGTTVKTKIPLTLAIIPGLVVRSGNKRFVIPQVSLIELVRIDGDPSRTGIEMVHGAPVYRLRGRLLPLVYLDRELKIEKKSVASEDDGVRNMVVLQADSRQFGLIADEIRDTEEIVVKPLDRRLKSLKTFAGATIMGDGVVALILDVLGLAQRAGVVSEGQDRAAGGSGAGDKETASDKQTFLVFSGPDDARMAVPLGALARLEEFPSSQVEDSGTESVIQYRGKILPLIYLKVVLEERRKRRRHPEAQEAMPDPESIQVLVCNHEGSAVGLVVEQILDIIADRADVKSPATRPGVLYAAVIDNRVTEMLDLEVVLKAATAPRVHEEEHARMGDWVIRKVLSDGLAPDSALEVVGTAANGRIALAKIPQVHPDLVTLDVEMPEMDGLETLAAIRKLYPKLPVIMFSTLTERGAATTLEALSLGASDYVTKPSNAGSLDVTLRQLREQLIPKIKALCPVPAETPAAPA